jgi:hypothetical protein
VDHEVEHYAHLGSARLKRSQTLYSQVSGRANRLLEKSHYGIVVLDVPYLYDAIMLVRLVHDCLGFLGGSAEGLFHEEMATRLKQGKSDLGVKIGRGHHADSVTGSAHLFETCESLAVVLLAGSGCRFIVYIQNPDQFTAFELMINASMMPT